MGEWKTVISLPSLFMRVVNKMLLVLCDMEHEPTKDPWSPPQTYMC